MKGSSAATEIEEAQNQLKGKIAEIVQVGLGVVDPLTTVVRIKSA
jgi:hypothetical protein